MQLTFMLRKPKFPVICDFDNTVVAFQSASDMAKGILKYPLDDTGEYDIIDSGGQSFILILRGDFMVGPSFFPNKWTKRRLIDLVNNRSNKKDDSLYILKNAGSKRLEVILRELSELLYSSDKQLNAEIKILKKEDLN